MKEGWEEKKLGQIIKLEYGKPLPDSKRKSDGKFPVYGANGEKDRTDEYYHDGKSIVVGRKGSAGELNFTEEKFWPLDVTYFVTFNEEENDLVFLFHLLKQLELPKLAKGVKPGINRNDVYDIDVIIPKLSEQKQIVKKLDKALSAISNMRAITANKLLKIEELEKSILHNAINGK
jgi:type I restriction enzyme S subunit